MASKKAIVGIDIGTKYSSIGIWTGNSIKTTTVPSCVAFSDDKEPMIVSKAQDQLDENVPNAVVDARRLIGERYSDIDAGEDLIKLWPFQVIPSNSCDQLNGYSAEQIVRMILMELKEVADNQLGLEEVVIDAVISVPCLFNNSQRIATIEAARMAGINVLRLISETSATALAYRWLDESCRKKRQEEHTSESRTRLMKKEENVLVFDIGGGTLSVAVIEIKPGWKEFEVKAVAGHTHLGGNDMDAALAGYCIREFTNLHPKRAEIMINESSENTLRSECELARMVLCSSDPHKPSQTTVNVESFDGVFPLCEPVTLDTIESLNKELFDVYREEVRQCLEDSRVSQVHEVILVGGCSDMTVIRDMLEDLCKVTEFCEFETHRSSVVHGAAILAASLSGAAVHGLQVSDVTPQSIGVQYRGMTRRNFIPRYTKIPSEKYDFETLVDSQGVLKFGVYEGESEVMKNNNLLGYFIFTGIHPNYTFCGTIAAVDRVSYITVSLSVNSDGILKVSATALGRRLLRPKMYKRKVSSEEIIDMRNDPDNDGQEEVERKKNAKNKVSLYIANMEREVPADFNRGIPGGVSHSQKMRLQKEVDEAVRWLAENELPQVIDSARKLEDLQRRCFRVFHESEYTKAEVLLTQDAYDSESDSEESHHIDVAVFNRDQGYPVRKSKQRPRAREQIVSRETPKNNLE